MTYMLHWIWKEHPLYNFTLKFCLDLHDYLITNSIVYFIFFFFCFNCVFSSILKFTHQKEENQTPLVVPQVCTQQTTVWYLHWVLKRHSITIYLKFCFKHVYLICICIITSLDWNSIWEENFKVKKRKMPPTSTWMAKNKLERWMQRAKKK